MTNLVSSSVWQMLCIRLCAEVLSGSVWPIYFHFRVIYDRYSLLRFYFRDEWRDVTWRVCVTSLCNKCYEHVLMPVLSCRGLCNQFTFHSGVFMTHILLGTPYRDLICVCMCDDSLYSVICDRFVLCDLRLCNVMNASLVITLECLLLGRVVSKWSVSLVPLVILP